MECDTILLYSSDRVCVIISWSIVVVVDNRAVTRYIYAKTRGSSGEINRWPAAVSIEKQNDRYLPSTNLHKKYMPTVL